MIEDLEGATTEPSRRGHVAVLSATTAGVALMLMVALVVPSPPVSAPPQPASREPIQAAGSVITIVSGSTVTFPSNPPSRLLFDAGGTNWCVDDSRPGSPYYLVFEGNRQVIAVPVDTTHGWLSHQCPASVPLVTGDTFRAPR